MPSADDISNAPDPSSPRGGAQAATEDAAGREEAEAAGGRGGEEWRQGTRGGENSHLHG